MKQKECPSCAMMIDDSAKVCPICKYEYPRPKLAYQIIAIILILLFIGFFVL